MRLLITGGSGFIGTNFIELLIQNKIENFINVDKQKPCNSAQEKYWIKCNLLNEEELFEIVVQFKPTHIVHLAAKTDTASDKLEDYIDNTEGTANLIRVIEKSDSVRHVVITSTQYVFKPENDAFPKTDSHFKPHTAYGESKKICEELTRNSAMNCEWTIIRPTNVWGPWHMRYPNELWRIIDKGWYFHPKNADPVKSFAYVKNVAHQILRILESSSAIVNKKVFYVGDMPINSVKWINCFSQELTGKNVRIIPKSLFYLIALTGNYLNKLHIPFPLNLLRFENMNSEYNTPMQKTIDAFGVSHPDLEKNIKETIDWIKNEGNPFFKYWRNKY